MRHVAAAVSRITSKVVVGVLFGFTLDSRADYRAKKRIERSTEYEKFAREPRQSAHAFSSRGKRKFHVRRLSNFQDDVRVVRALTVGTIVNPVMHNS